MTREYGKRVTTLSRPKAHKSELVDYKAKASPKDWTKKKKPVDLDSWTAKKATKKKSAKPAKATKAKRPTKKTAR